jgi:Mg/Co/Ni transporter MgtE
LPSARRCEIHPDQLHTVFVVDDGGRLVGSVPVAALVKAAGHQPVAGIIDSGRPSVTAESDTPEIARVMTDFNLMSLPVVDGDGRPIGVLAVDDILELLLPEDWRRRFGLARD